MTIIFSLVMFDAAICDFGNLDTHHQLYFHQQKLLNLLILCIDSSVQHQLHFQKHELLHLLTLFVGASMHYQLNWQPMLMLYFSVAAVNFAVVSLDIYFFSDLFLIHPYAEG